MLDHFELAAYRFTLRACDTVHLPAVNKGNTLRGGFGICFKRLVCLSPGRCRLQCEHPDICPYARIFEPSPPPGAGRLSANSDIPRPFVIRPPLDRRTELDPGSRIEFDLLLFGSVIDFFPYFAVAFRSLAGEGLGPGRGRLEMDRVAAVDVISGRAEDLYCGRENLLRPPEWRIFASALVAGANRGLPLRLEVEFLTPTLIKAGGRMQGQPEFHQIFKRIRDRINALSCFYSGQPLDIDFRGLGELAERVKTIESDIHWEARFRRSSRTGHRHPMGGFTGRLTFEGDWAPFWPFLILGQFTHVGKYAVWGNGWYRISSR